MREYLKIKANVDLLKIIQVGITLSDETGRRPQPVSTWQFNFDFNVEVEPQAQTSIQLLRDSGINFANLRQHGISPRYFAEKVTESGLVLNPRLTWICFHGCYDFGYLIKILTNETLPHDRRAYEQLLRVYFPSLLDIKTFRQQFNLGGSLDHIAYQLGVNRVGTSHQAGSDSQVTSEVFFAIFDHLKTEASKREYQQVVDAYNNDVYGYQNH